MQNKFYKIFLPTEQAMLDFGADCASLCIKGLVIFLYGNLGAGKTTFTRGFLRGLGHKGSVKSPTYTIVEPYQFEHFALFHFDLYRVHNMRELEYIGIQDYFLPETVCLIEWPEHGEQLLPPADISLHIKPCGEGREIKIVAHSDRGSSVLHQLESKKI